MAVEMTLGQLESWLTGLALAAARIDYGRAAQATAVMLAASGKRSIAESRSPDGRPFAPLKRRQGKPLHDKGLLAASISARSAAFQGGFAAEQTVGVDYGLAQDQGFTVSKPERRRSKPWVFTKGGKTVFTRRIRAHGFTVPARPFLGFNEATVDRVAMVTADQALKQLFG